MKARLNLIFASIGLLGLSSSISAQSGNDLLPRRGYFGVGLEKAEGGARVFSVAPDSTAASAGIGVGTIIEAVDGNPATSPQIVVEAIGHHKSGESVKIDVRQETERRTINAVLKPFPFEQMSNATIHYGSVLAVPDVRLRTILSTPSGRPGPFPAVLLIQGGGCGSIDAPFSPTVAQPGLMHTIGSQGFVTMRVDIVALIALTHQTRIHNLITRANYETLRAIQDEKNPFKGLSVKSDGYSDITLKRIRDVVEPLVRGMFFANEALLTDTVRGTSTFAEDFEKSGVRDSKGRSLKDLDLNKRFLRYPLSYLIYSQAFDEMPAPAKNVFYERAWTILSGGDTANFRNLSMEDRTAIREILEDTKPDFVRAAHK